MAAPVDKPLADESTPQKGSKKASLTKGGKKQLGERGWFVIHTYAGYEDQVAESLRQRIDSFGMKDYIFDVIVPKEKQIEIKEGKRRIVEKRIYPGYVLVDMIVTDDSWYVVRNTPNVTGFIGLGVRPTPISQEEVDRIKKRMGVEEPKYKIELKEDDISVVISKMTGTPVGTANNNNEIPKEFALEQNYPNPFNPITKIIFALPPSPAGEGLGVRVAVYDILGREVQTLVNEKLKSGVYEITFDASNLSSGVYYYKLNVVETTRRVVFTDTKKMVVVK